MLPEMTNRTQEVLDEQNSPAPPPPDQAKKDKERREKLKAGIDICKSYRRKLIQNWARSIDARRGKPFPTQTDDQQVSVPLDWSLTKTKQASLFSQIPQVRVSHPPQSGAAGPWLASFEGKLNDTLISAGIESAMDEVLPDCINAAGIGVVIVSYESITEDKDMGMGSDGKPIIVPQPVDTRYVTQRISPSDFLWPIDFTGSDFDNAPWVGRSGRVTWAEAVQRFGVTEAEKDRLLGEDRTILDKLSEDMERDKTELDKVGFEEIFYKEFMYHEESKSYSTIRHTVFLTGKEKPVIDEPWKGQKIGPDGKLMGAQKFPIRVLSLAYISDEAIPPSDSAIGRPQVNEINKGRDQMIKQRERNLPLRWVNINLADPTILQGLMRGTWANIVPVQGDGTRILGEVAKGQMPKEDFTFDQIAKNDLNEAWTIGPNQLGSGAQVETKGESDEIADNFQTRVGRERAKVASFFVGIAQVLGGLICLFEDPSVFGEGFDPGFSKNLAFSVLADSTVLISAKQRLDRLDAYLNNYAKSGFVVIEPVLREIAILDGLDPNVVVKAPDPQSPPPPNVSLRLTGSEDMMNPLLLSIYLAEGKPPTPELIEKAKQMIQAAVLPLQPPQMGPDGMPLPPGGPPPMGPDGQPMPGGPPPGPPPTPVGEANPQMTILPKIAKRSDDPSAGGKE